MNRNKNGDEDRLAKGLEKAHEKLLGREQEELPADHSIDEDLVPAKNMLELIDRMKRKTDTKSDEARGAETKVIVDTPNDESASSVDEELDFILNADAKKISRFELMEQLGQGGFGLVFRAYDPELDREVAIKIPRLEKVFTSDLRTRFIREAKTAAALSHPNIVTIYEADTHGSICFLVSEYIRGETLADWASRNREPIAPRAAASLIAVLADAVQHAHSRGVIHRDIKPTNILIEDSSGGKIVAEELAKASMITDFGLAKFESEIENQTRSGAIIGTPMYMAPEQIKGVDENIDFRCDVYSLGTVLYELLIGRPPFTGATIVEIVTAVQNSEPVKPRTRRPDIPTDLEAICLKCLEKKPDSRYSSARELENDLQRFLDGIPVHARPVTTIDRVFRWANRNRGLAAALCSLAIVLAVAFFVTSALWLRNDFLRRESESRKQLAESRRQLAERRFDELEDAIDTVYASVKNMPEIENNDFGAVREELLSNVNRFYTSLVREAPTDPDLKRKKVDSLLKLIKLKSTLSDNAGATDIAEKIIKTDANKDTGGDVDVDQKIDAMILAANSFFAQRETDRGQQYFDTALKLAKDRYQSKEQPDDQDRIELARTISRISDVASIRGLRTLSNALAIEAIGIWEDIDSESIVDDEATLAMARTFLLASKSHAAAEKIKPARLYNDFAIQLFEDALSDDARELPNVRFDASEAYRIRGFLFIKTPEDCVANLDKSIEIITSLIDGHPTVVKYHCQVLSINYFRGLVEYIAADKLTDPKESLRRASEEFQKNVELAERLTFRFPENAEDIIRSANNSIMMLGTTAGKLGDHEKQLDALTQSLKFYESLYETTGNQDHLVLTIANRGNIAYYYVIRKDYDEAIRRYEETISDLTRILETDPQAGQVDRFLSGDYERLAEAYAKVERFDDALDAHQQSMAHTKHFPVARTKGMEAVYLTRVGNIDDARFAFQEFVDHQTKTEGFRLVVGHGSRLMLALDENDVDQESVIELRKFAVEQAIKALDAIAIKDPAAFKILVENEELAPLKATIEFQQRFQ